MIGGVPVFARALGLAGLLPQFGAAAVLVIGPLEWRGAAHAFAILYAATVLAFLGGAWWGIAAAAPAAERRRTLDWLWFVSVATKLVALACLLAWTLGNLPPEPVLVSLGAAMLISLAVDTRFGQLAPRWWMALRVPASIGMSAATLGAAFA